jgi:uncharacterized surface protein with fasciclin (FAS1) repeats
MRRFALSLMAGALVVGMIAGPVAAKQPDSSGSNIVDTAIALNASGPYANQFDTLIVLVVQLDLADALSARGQLTVFAPTDLAFENSLNLTTAGVPAAIEALGADTVRNIVLYHVAQGALDSEAVLGSSKIRMLNGQFAAVNAGAGTIDGAPIIETDVIASNGIIHAVSAVLLP